MAEFPQLLKKADVRARRRSDHGCRQHDARRRTHGPQAWSRVRAQYAQALLVLAPRHPARFDEVAQILSHSASNFARRTLLASEEAEVSCQLAAPDVLLLDTIGELAGIMELADVVFIGGSLVPTGGHNILEAAYWAKPVFSGRTWRTFEEITSLFLASNAGIQVRDASDLAECVLDLFRDPAAGQRLGERAKRSWRSKPGQPIGCSSKSQRLLLAHALVQLAQQK